MMKNIKKIFLTLLLLFLIGGIQEAKSQNNCNAAITWQNNNCNEYQFQSNQYFWISFVADTFAYYLSITPPNGTPATITDVFLYSDSCNDLTLLKSQNNQQFDSLKIFADSLIPGYKYYICIKQDTSLSNYFRLCIDLIPNRSWVPNDCTPPTYCTNSGTFISNGEFYPNTTLFNDDNPFMDIYPNMGVVCGWRRGWGDPQIYTLNDVIGFPVLSAGEYAAYMWSGVNDVDNQTVMGEGIFHKFYFDAPQPNEKYSLSFLYACNNTINLNVVLTNDDIHFFPSLNGGYDIHNFNTWQGSDLFLDQNDQLSNTNQQFLRKTFCFSNLSETYDKLCIFPTSPYSTTSRGLAIDKVSLIKHSFQITSLPDTIDCGSYITIETEFCPGINNVQDITWNFNWSSGQTTQNITVTPISTTTYVVTATNSCGYTFTDDITIVVNPLPDFYTENECLGDVIYFYGSALCSSGITAWSWDFGDGGTANGQNTSHVYENAGVYPVVLTITDINNNTFTVIHYIVIYEAQKPILNYFVNNTCNTEGGYLFPYEIINAQQGVTYEWSLDPPGCGYFNEDPNSTTATGTNVTITWDPNYIPSLPDHATIHIVASNEYGCYSPADYSFFQCCTWENDPPEGLYFLNNTDAQSSLQNYQYGGESFLINGNFFINQDMNFTTCNFFMGPESQIIIQDGISVTFTDGDFLKAQCGYMWKGILLEDGTSEIGFYDSYINDAYNAIEARYGAVISVIHNNFINNYIGLKIIDYLPRESLNPYPASIFYNKFLSNENLITPNVSNVCFYPPYDEEYLKPFSGIYIEDVFDISIGSSEDNPNEFSILHNGIWALSSEVTVHNNVFENIHRCFQPSQYICPYTINASMGNGVYSESRITQMFQNNPIDPTIIVGGSGTNESNSFEDCDYGVYTYNNPNLDISYNTITDSKIGIHVAELTNYLTSKSIFNNTISESNTGIYLNNIKNAQVKFNVITDINALTFPFQTLRQYGIRCSNAKNAVVYGNEIYYTYSVTPTDTRIEGITCQNSTAAVQCNEIKNVGRAMCFYGNNIPSTVSLNRMYDCIDGVYLNNGTIGQQGSSGKPSDNQWNGTFTNHTNSYNSLGYSSPFYVRDYNNPYWANNFYPLNIIMGGQYPIYPLGTTGLGSACMGIQAEPIAISFNKDAGLMIYENTVDYYEYTDENQWLAAHNVYNYLMQDDTLDDWEPEFLYNYDVNGKLIDSVKQLFGYYDFDGADAVLGNINLEGFPIEKLHEVYSIINNAAINVPNTLNGNIVFSSYQLDNLREIAWMCPWEVGDAVYIARMLLSFYEDSIYYNVCEGYIDQRKTKDSIDDVQTKLSVLVYPNPAANEFFVEISGNNNEQSVTFELYNLYGNLVKKVVIYGNNKISVNTSGLASAIYYYQLKQNNAAIMKDKIIIIK